MAHTAPPSNTRRHLELASGLVLLLVGAVIAVVAVMALNHPAGRQAASAAETKPAGSSSPQVSATAPSSHPASATGSGTPSSQSSGNAPAATASPSTTPSQNTSAAGSGKLPIIVLNNTSSTPGEVAADRFRQAGWTVTDVSTFDGAILSTAAYYDPNVSGAQAAAEALQQQFPAIKRVKEKFDGLPEGPIVVVLTSDYS